MTNLYETLKVTKDSTKDKIKKGYRKMAKKYHPDKGGNSKQFQEVALAYNVLSDDKKRKQYDETGQIPKDSPDNFYSKFRDLLVHQFIPAILKCEDYEQQDLIKIFRNYIKSNIKTFEKNSIEIDNRIDKLKKVLKRISKKKKDKQKTPIIEMTIEGSIDGFEDEKQKLKEEIEFFKKVYDIMNTYKYKIDKIPQMNNHETYINNMPSTEFFKKYFGE